jgi:hypothetical protein
MDEGNIKKNLPRNELGDLEFPSIHTPVQINDYIRRWQHTYIFQYYDNERQNYWPCFDLLDDRDKKLEQAKKQTDFAEVHLFKTPDTPTDNHIQHHNWQLELYIKYFNEVFNMRAYVDGFMPNFKYWRLILRKTTYNAILDCINAYKLQPISDLIFEIIANAQDIYLEEVAHWETKEMQDLITSAKPEAQKVISLIEKVTDESWVRDQTAKVPAGLSHINFAFKEDKTITLKHPWLIKQFIELFKEHYEKNYPYKNWRKELNRYHGRFEDIIHKQEFKNRLASSMYNLLSEEHFFSITTKPYPNDLMLCIARLIEFCLIPVHSFDDSDEVKTKHIRNWLIRNKKRYDMPPAEERKQIVPNKQKLLKYFDAEFINSTGDLKPLDAIATAWFLCERFNIMPLFDDIVQIVHCLRERCSQFRMYSAMSDDNLKQEITDLNALTKLYKTMQTKGKINQVKFKIAGDENEYQLSEPLSMYLINRAMREAMGNHPEEYEVDILKSTVESSPDGSSFIINYDTRLNRPEERFAPQFVKSFYAYLLNEAPPGEFEYNKSEDYYMLIALAMQECWFFNHKMEDEKGIQWKVKHWHQLALHFPQ